MKTLLAALMLLTLTACGLTPQGDFIRGTVQTKGAEVADEGLDNSVWFICKASSVGAVVRKFGASDGLWDAWKVMCLTSTELENPTPEADK